MIDVTPIKMLNNRFLMVHFDYKSKPRKPPSLKD